MSGTPPDFITWRQRPATDDCRISKDTQEPGVFSGWDTLVITMDGEYVKYFVNGTQQWEPHRYANDGVTLVYPLNYMKILFRNGACAAIPDGAESVTDIIDWVYFAHETVLSPREVKDIVAALRASGKGWKNTVPNPLAASTTKEISGTGTTNFNDLGSTTGTTIDIASVTGTGSITVERYVTSSVNPLFSGQPPTNISDYRWVISQLGLSDIAAEVRFKVSEFPSGISNPNTVTIYSRPVEDYGTFTALPTTYEGSTGELVAPVSGFSEFILGSNDNPLSHVKGQRNTPMQLELFQNYPNPFNPSTVVRFSLPYRSHVQLIVFDVLGRSVKVLVDAEQEAGHHEVQLAGSDLTSGVYFYRLKAGDCVQTRRMMILK